MAGKYAVVFKLPGLLCNECKQTKPEAYQAVDALAPDRKEAKDMAEKFIGTDFKPEWVAVVHWSLYGGLMCDDVIGKPAGTYLWDVVPQQYREQLAADVAQLYLDDNQELYLSLIGANTKYVVTDKGHNEPTENIHPS